MFAKRKKKKKKKITKNREQPVDVKGERVPSGSSWTTRREDPSITYVLHLLPVARTCRTSSLLQRHRRGSLVPSFALIVLGVFRFAQKVRNNTKALCSDWHEENNMRIFRVIYVWWKIGGCWQTVFKIFTLRFSVQHNNFSIVHWIVFPFWLWMILYYLTHWIMNFYAYC